MILIDDLGWNNVPWHDSSLAQQMPVTSNLVQQGIEIDRHYAHYNCAPTRVSFLSGRTPHHIAQYINGALMDPRVTAIPRKLKSAGYATHMVGKWHAGFGRSDQMPLARGFDTFFGMLSGAVDHYTQRWCIDNHCDQPNNDNFNGTVLPGFEPLEYSTDLWLNDAPAYGRTGRYSTGMWTEFAVQTIEQHEPSQPLFYYYCPLVTHTPLQVPQEYSDRFSDEWTWERRQYAGMFAFVDEAIGNITNSLRQKGMWEHTLVVFSSDNGGPIEPSTAPGFDHCGGANNWPLFGGKNSFFEGGIRVAAFVSGGFLPSAVRGSKLEGYIHIADWYATFCGLAAVDPSDDIQGIPAIDSLDMWPYLAGDVSASPRNEIAINMPAALISGDYKLMGGAYFAFRQRPAWPDETSCCEASCQTQFTTDMCGTVQDPRCLFNIRNDPNEEINLFESEPEIAARMLARIQELNAESFEPPDTSPVNTDYWNAHYQGFVGPSVQ
jgi:arylsulfatase I/J